MIDLSSALDEITIAVEIAESLLLGEVLKIVNRLTIVAVVAGSLIEILCDEVVNHQSRDRFPLEKLVFLNNCI